MKSNQEFIKTASYGRINYVKKFKHSNYFKKMAKDKLQKEQDYYLPLQSWIFQNMMKIKVRELKEKLKYQEETKCPVKKK